MNNKKKVNVLLLETIFHMGGVETLLYNVMKHFDKERFNIILCTLYHPGPMGKPFMDDGYLFYHDLIRIKFDIRVFFKLRKIIIENKIDIIYLVTQPLTLFWGVIIGKVCRIPIVCLIGNTVVIGEHVKLNIYKLLLPFVDRVVAQASIQKEHWIKNVGVPEHLMSVIYNGVSLERFDLEVNRKEKLFSLGIEPSHKIIGITGRLVKLKGMDIFLRAARQIITFEQNVHFIVVGDGPEMPMLKSLSEELRLNDKLSLLGFRDDLVELLSVFDIAVLSSRTEAFPMVLLEYMAAGKPVVATNVGSVQEVLTDRVTGLLVEPENANALADNIIYLLNNMGLAEKMGREARKTVQEKYRLDTTARKTQELFEELIHDKGKRLIGNRFEAIKR